MKTARRVSMLILLLCCCIFVSLAIAGDTFQQIRKNMETMTALQFKEYAKTLKGQEISWVGWVDEVKEKFFGGYEVWIDMDPPSELSVQDISIEVPKDLALKLKKDQKIAFTGRIDTVISVLGSCQVMLKDAKITKF